MIKGTKYAIGYMVICYYEDDVPVFGKIKDILLQPNKDNSLFILTPFTCTRFNRHFYSYEVVATEETLIYQQEELLDYHPLYLSKSFNVSSPLFVRTKYYVQ